MSIASDTIVDAGKGIRFKRNTSDIIPVLDFSPMLSSDPEIRKQIAPALRKACTDVGFFYLVNHGIPDAVIRRAYQAMQRYFALPAAEKMKHHYMSTPNHRGYVGNGDINADHELKGNDMHEAFEAAHDLPEDDPDYLKGIKFYGPNHWPDAPPEFASAIGTYFDTQLEFGKTMLRAFALALALPEDYFDAMYNKPMSRLRACYYPPQQPDWDLSKIGIGAHRDYELFTTVWQSPQPGLQVKGVGGDWVEVTPIDGTFVINLGNLMQRWSNDVFLSRPHRVVNLTTEHRYSIVQFFGVDYDATLDAFPTCVTAERPARYSPISCGKNTEDQVAQTYYKK